MQDPRHIDPALRARYDVRGPRYTSYPPANHFGPIDTGALFSRWGEERGAPGGHPLSLYLHIPFCRARCLFCGCHTSPARGELVDRYVDALLAEMRMARERLVTSRPVIQVALGGGTPNFLSEGQLDRLLSGLEQLWSISPEAELSVEIDPRTSTPAKLDLLLSHRFNRFSLGVQDLEESVISHFRRGQDLMQIEEVASSLRSQGCSALNFDLIYGLPGQTLETAARTAEKVIRLGPSRIALYAYAHVPWIHPHQSAVEKLGLPDPDLKLAIFLHMLDRFQDAGYEPIGMDHFARPEDPLAQALREGKLRRNFMGYSTGRGIDVLGLGASSISSMGSTYSQNEKDVPTYIEEIGNGRPPVARGFLLDRDDQIRRELIIDLFCNFTVDFEALGKRFGLDVLSYFAGELDRLEPLAKDGLVHWGARGLQATETGRFFIRNICMVFDRYLEREAGHRVYSRTV